MTEGLQAFGFCFVEEAFFSLVFPSSELSSGQRLELSRSLFPSSLLTSTWASFLLISSSLPITLCASCFLTRARTVRLHCSNSLQISPLSEARKGDSSFSNIHLTFLGQKLRHYRVCPQNCPQREFSTLRVVRHFVPRRTQSFEGNNVENILLK